MADGIKACPSDDAALLLHLSGNNAPDSAIEDGTFTVFVDSSLYTHMAVSVSPRDTVADLKSKIRTEHQSCFPALGDIVIHAIKVKRRRLLYHLSDSMLVKSAFNRQMRTWFLHMDVSTLCTFKHQEEPRQGLSTPEIDVQMEIPESSGAVTCKQVDRTLKRLVDTATDECKESGDASELCIISSDIGNLSKDSHLNKGFSKKSDNPDDQLLHLQNTDLVNRKFIVSEQTVQGNSEGKTLNVFDAVGENPTSDPKASISAEERVDLNKLQKCNTGMDLNVGCIVKEGVNFDGLKSGIVSLDAVPSKFERRNRGQDASVDGSALEDLVVPVSGNEKERKKKRKSGLLELDNASFKEDVAVNTFHTAEKSEFGRRADLNPQGDEDANIDKPNCTPEDLKGENKSSSDLVKAKRKKTRVPKSRAADHDNSSLYQEVVEGECNGKDSHSLKRTVDMINIGNANVISQDGESELSASYGMDEKDLKVLPLVEESRDSNHATQKKRKKPKRTRNHVALALEAPSVNHHNDSPGNELPSVSEHSNIANNGDITDQINGTKSLEKMNLYAETKKGAGCTVSCGESLTSMWHIGINVVPEKETVRAEDAVVSKDSSKKKKSKKTESAVAERCVVPQVEADGFAPNAFGSEHMEPMQERSTYNNKDGGTEKRKKSHKKVKNMDSEMSVPDGQLLSPSTIKESCELNKQGSFKVQLTNNGSLTSKQSQEKSINLNMESIHEGAVEGDGNHDDGCSNNGDTPDQINGIKSEKMKLYAENRQVDAGCTLTGNESLTSMKGLGIDGVPEKEITRPEDGMAIKDRKRKKSRKTESAVAERCIVPQVEANKVDPNAVSLEHVEPMDERSTYSKKGGSTEKVKKSRKKVKIVDSEISMPDSQLLSPSTLKEKHGHNKHGYPKTQLTNGGALTSKPSQEKSINPNMESIHEGAVEGDADHDDGCSNNGDITDQINGTKSSEKMNLYGETKEVDAGYTLSGNESLTSMKVLGTAAVPDKEITRAEDGMVSKDSKRKKSKKTESAVAERCIVPQVEVDRVAPNAVGLEHVEPMDERKTDSKKGGSTEKVKKSRKRVKNVDSEISLPDSQLLSPSTVKGKSEQNDQGSSKMQLTNSGALTSKPSQEKIINLNMESIHEAAAEGGADSDDDCSSSSDKVKDMEIHHLQKDSLNFIDYFVPGLNADVKQVQDEGAASGKKTKKAHTEQNSSALPSEAVADISGASNHVRSSKGRDSEEQSDATTDASLSSLSASSHSHQSLDSSGSETLSSHAESDDLAHGHGYFVMPAARNNVGSIGRKMAQRPQTRSVTAGTLSDILKSSSTCRKAVLQASKSKHVQSKVDDGTDSPPVDTVAETQDC
ncbi:uncharacterized protein LOC116250498 isoform X2 [Nymphaea colorata]|uniref:uncharacterized protein LOC116250498 isoform X2 n=1 Tax=Nymphaea colorata TaxID=210225 RepID=UPI00129EC832|nr:uncharacterized protein LOC116250498 isoform X2 [Nymphaea colorata]